MKKEILLILMIMVLPGILALNLDIKEISSQNVVIDEFDNPAIIKLEITNLGESTEISFTNLYGSKMEPEEKISISKGETKDIQLKIWPREDLDFRGTFVFNYIIRGSDFSSVEREQILRILKLEQVFEVGSSDFSPEKGTMNVYIKNKEDYDFEGLKARFSSALFNFEESFDLASYEKKVFSVDLNKEEVRKLMAGFYTMNVDVTAGNKKAGYQESIKFEEKDLVKTTTEEHGLIIKTDIIQKSNEGNTIEGVEVIVEKNILSRLFTSFSPEPSIVSRDGSKVYYIWNEELNPGEDLRVVVRTNWLFPLLVILFIIVVVILAKMYSNTYLVMRKKVSFVRAKGGEFALKVSILVNAKKDVEKITIIDKLPPLVKIHERFGAEAPTRVDEKRRRIEWNISSLGAGESRIITYLIYSKIGVLGRFALPSATAIFEKDGKIHESSSNRAFFVAEQRGKIEED